LTDSGLNKSSFFRAGPFIGAILLTCAAFICAKEKYAHRHSGWSIKVLFNAGAMVYIKTNYGAGIAGRFVDTRRRKEF